MEQGKQTGRARAARVGIEHGIYHRPGEREDCLLCQEEKMANGKLPMGNGKCPACGSGRVEEIGAGWWYCAECVNHWKREVAA